MVLVTARWTKWKVARLASPLVGALVAFIVYAPGMRGGLDLALAAGCAVYAVIAIQLGARIRRPSQSIGWYALAAVIALAVVAVALTVIMEVAVGPDTASAGIAGIAYTFVGGIVFGLVPVAVVVSAVSLMVVDRLAR